MLSFEETILHIRKAKAGDIQSKQILIENNVLLIKSIVNRFRNKGVDYDDLFQLGSKIFFNTSKRRCINTRAS